MKEQNVYFAKHLLMEYLYFQRTLSYGSNRDRSRQKIRQKKMSPIENVVTTAPPETIESAKEVIVKKQDRSRNLFGVQLEVTSLLLEAERRKLNVLQKELQVALEEGGSIKAKEHQKQELLIAIARIQAQYDHLDKEYREHAIGALLSANTRGSGKSNRSQPAIGLKHTPKSRPTIFGTVASDLTPKDCTNRRSLPQTPQPKGFCSYNNGDNSTSEYITDYSTYQENALVYKDGNLVSGPLEALIQHMVPTDSYYPDRAYLFAFLLSSRLFIKPHDLLSRICAVCDAQQGLGKPAQTGSLAAHAQFANHLVQLLAEWTETFPYDFRDERVMEHVRTITEQCYTISPHLRSSVSALLQNLLQRLTALEQYEAALQQHACATSTAQQAQHHHQQQVQQQHHNTNGSGGSGVDTVDGVLTLSPTTIIADISELCPNAGTLAQQLTHVELERLSFIGPEEFVQAFAKENPHLETSFKDMKKTHNLEQYVQWFNRLSYLVATQVCRYPKKKQRVRVVEFWIEVGRECFNIGNFNSLMAIIAGLNMSPISRLKKTWSKIQSGKFAILEHQMDPSSNFTSYRSTLKAAMWRSAGATDQRQRIVIPFFSLLVKDLYFLNQGCSNKLPNGHINFDKFWQLAKQVTEFIAWKQVTCPFEKDAKIIALIQQGPVLTENALALASFDCEPPENNQEKERCKTLKLDVNNAAA